MTQGAPQRRRGRWRLAAAGYVLLLAASYLVWAAYPPRPELGPRDRVLELEEVRDGARGEQRVRLVYRDYPADVPDAQVLLMLHGSPGGMHDFTSLAQRLRGRFRIVVPDLPGFGKSRQAIPDYSVEAHAHYMVELLEELDLPAVHVVPFSMAGAVALHLADLAPERVHSITMVACIGVQELELFGSYELNHVVHGLQLAVIDLVRWLAPHFGRFESFPLGHAYARNFFDTDQRPVRELLDRYDAPMLILHGTNDFLVPIEAAREHHRLVPQSELVELDTGHFLLWTDTDEVADRISAYVERAERGGAARREDAMPARSERARAPFDPAVVPRLGATGLLIAMLLLAAATLVSEDLTCIGAGLLVAQGRIGFVPAVVACFLGIFVGDLMLYFLGRWLGRPALARAPLRWFVQPASVERASAWFSRRGGQVIFLSRFAPGLRLPTYFAAGAAHTSLAMFAGYFILAAVVWTPILVGLAVWAGQEAFDLVEAYALPALLVLALGLLMLERLLVPLLSARGRRTLIGRCRRWAHWEFWPPGVFYIPVVGYVCWLALRHRSLTVVTAVNPAIPTSGFIGESKTAILEAFGDDPRVARWCTLALACPEERRRERAAELLSRTGLPLVLKPDIGQRGSGVVVLRREEALWRAVADLACDSILQEYVPGPEFGVFYVRIPGEPRGSVFSITKKRTATVVGDGTSTLEELVLRDDRAVCMARIYFENLGARVGEVPARGEEVPLVELGTHCRGAIFLDGGELRSAALESAIDDLSKRFDGFWFGRYDVRGASADQLSAGRGFKMIELNGVTSEATHIYDPKNGLFQAYRVLFEQWRLAYDIGARNVERGARPSSLTELARRLWAYRRLKKRHTSPSLSGVAAEVPGETRPGSVAGAPLTRTTTE